MGEVFCQMADLEKLYSEFWILSFPWEGVQHSLT